MRQHKWKSSWPGNCCVACGRPDPYESDEYDFIDCPDCTDGCDTCCRTGCIPNPDANPLEECPGADDKIDWPYEISMAACTVVVVVVVLYSFFEPFFR